MDVEYGVDEVRKARSDVLRKTHQPGLFLMHAKTAAS